MRRPKRDIASYGLATPFPLDIWTMVFDYMDEHSDVLSLMFTSSTLYALGIRTLLGLPVWFENIVDLKSFCDFVTSDLARRPGFIRQLTLTIDLPRLRDEDLTEADEDEAELLRVIPNLAMVLARATRLLEFRIGYAEELLQRAEISLIRGVCPAHLCLNDAIASMPSVMRLRLASCGPRTAALLHMMSSPLEQVDVKFYNTRSDNHIDFRQLLSPHYLTLMELTLWNTYMGHSLSPSTPRFPMVHTLMLRKAVWPSLAVLLHAFPGLSILDIACTTNFWRGLYQTGISQDAVALREFNHGTAAHAASSWPSLEGLRGDLETLYVLGVTGRVEVLEIGNFDVHESFVRMLNAVLTDVHSTHLILHVGYLQGGEPYCRRMNLVTLLQHVPAPEEITHFQLNIRSHVLLSVSPFYDVLNLGLVKEALVPFRRLRYLKVLVGRDQAMSVDDDPAVSTAQLSRFALSIATAQPNLQYLSIAPYFAQHSRWAVVRTATGTTLRQLPTRDDDDLFNGYNLFEDRRPKYIHPVLFVSDLAGVDELGFESRGLRDLTQSPHSDHELAF